MTTPDDFTALKQRFVARAQSDADALATAVRQADWAEAERLVHGFAGAAGMFGFSNLSANALLLDAEFASGTRPDAARLEALIAEAKAIDQS